MAKPKKPGIQYEKYIANRLKSKGFYSVKQTSATGDHGIDILATKNGTRYAIQCKYYSSPVGNKAVQEAYTGCKYYGCDVPVVITNNSFTKSAIDEAKQVGVLLWSNNKINNRNSFGDLLIVAVLYFLYVYIAISKRRFLWEILGVFPFLGIIIPVICLLLYVIKKMVLLFFQRSKKDLSAEPLDILGDFVENDCLQKQTEEQIEQEPILIDTDILEETFLPESHIDTTAFDSPEKTIQIFDNSNNGSDLTDATQVTTISKHNIRPNTRLQELSRSIHDIKTPKMSTVSKHQMNKDELEQFMRECNGRLEHQDEIEQYKDYLQDITDES